MNYFCLDDVVQPPIAQVVGVSRFEVELRLSGDLVRIGLAEGGSRGYINRFVNSFFLPIDGFVQRIPEFDLKVVLRGTEADLDYVINRMRLNLPAITFEQIRWVRYSIWSFAPSFVIIRSSSRFAIKSPRSGDSNDNHSVRSNSRHSQHSV